MSQHLSTNRLAILDIASMSPDKNRYCKRATCDQEKWLNWTSKVLASFQHYNGFVNKLEPTQLNLSLRYL
jgi:hypothetical protein